MAEITFDESLRQTGDLRRRAMDADLARDWAAALTAWQALLAHPCAHHQVDAGETWDSIHHVHRSAGDYDAAIAAKREAIAAGYRSVPDPEADIAECLVLAGRRPEGDRLFAELKERDPDDVWLDNAAGFIYAAVGDHEEALRWLRQGIELAIATGDPEELITQLTDMHDSSRSALGLEPDAELDARVRAFAEAPGPDVTPPERWADHEPLAERACHYCDFEPATSYAEQDERERRARRRRLQEEAPAALSRLDQLFSGDDATPLGAEMPLSSGWFPAGEWEKAVARWPDLLDELPRDHTEYSHAIEARIKWAERAMRGRRLLVSALTVEGLVRYADGERLDPGSGEARAAYAARRAIDGAASRWPPGRNEPCWCGSGRKYKRCCGPIPAADLD